MISPRNAAIIALLIASFAACGGTTTSTTPVDGGMPQPDAAPADASSVPPPPPPVDDAGTDDGSADASEDADDGGCKTTFVRDFKLCPGPVGHIVHTTCPLPDRDGGLLYPKAFCDSVCNVTTADGGTRPATQYCYPPAGDGGAGDVECDTSGCA
jgi:hypothetical protein